MSRSLRAARWRRPGRRVRLVVHGSRPARPRRRPRGLAPSRSAPRRATCTRSAATGRCSSSAACDVSPFAAELAALSESELPGPRRATSRTARRCRSCYLSVHAPSEGAAGCRSPSWCDLLAGCCRSRRRDRRASRLRSGTRRCTAALGRRLVIENMDARKPGGRSRRSSSRRCSTRCRRPGSASTSRTRVGRPDDGRGRRAARRVRRPACATCTSPRSTRTATTCRSTEQRRVARSRPLLRRCRDVPWILEAPLSRPSGRHDRGGRRSSGSAAGGAGASRTCSPRASARAPLARAARERRRRGCATDAAVVLFGSWGRRELTAQSDDDWAAAGRRDRPRRRSCHGAGRAGGGVGARRPEPDRSCSASRSRRRAGRAHRPRRGHQHAT